MRLYITNSKTLEKLLKRNRSVITNEMTVTFFFKIGTIAVFSHCFGKGFRHRLNKSSNLNIVEQTFVIRPGVLSSPKDLEGLRCLTAFRMSNSEMEGNRRNYWTIYQSDSAPEKKYYKLIVSVLTSFSYLDRLTTVVPFTSS